MVAILGYSRAQIVDAVQRMYTAVAARPDDPFHFPVGRAAAERLGYRRPWLAGLPPSAVEAFAGVGCPFSADAVRPGDVVLDIGAGAGVDALLAGQRTGPAGCVIACDLTFAMLRRLRREADGVVVPLQASAEALPLADGSVDAITSNGALNLVPDKRRAVAEMFRVLRPGGRVQLADVVIRRPVTVDCSDDPRLWVECVVGATVDEELLRLLADAGFEAVTVTGRHDYFALSPSAQTREIAAGFGAYSMELSLRRGDRAPGFLRRLRRLDPRRAVAWIRRRGLVGLTAVIVAIAACYGTLAATALLGLVGVRLALDETLWAGAIALPAGAAVTALLPGLRRHRRPEPLLAGAAGAAGVFYALFVTYQPLIELGGFALLAAGVAGDIVLRRRREAALLGMAGATDG